MSQTQTQTIKVEIALTDMGTTFKKIRKAMGMHQAEFAKKINRSVAHISNLENGNTQFSSDMLKTFQEALGVTVKGIIEIDPYVYHRMLSIKEKG